MKRCNLVAILITALVAAALCRHAAAHNWPGKPAATEKNSTRAWRDKPAAAQKNPAQAQRLRLAPQMQAGQTLRYQMDFRSTADVRSEGLAENPQGGGPLELHISSTVKMEVLGVAPSRIRVTYEKTAANALGDNADPTVAALQRQYAKLQGRSVVLTLDAEGKVASAEGLEEIIPDPKAASATLESISKMLTGPAPAQGIAVGEKWSEEHALPDAPLLELTVRGESTYLRNEPCRANAAGALPAGSLEEICAVILTRSQTGQRGTPRDPTPAEYRERGLRTTGRWNGTSESLTLVSLRTGWVVSATQTGAEELDYTVSVADSSARIRNFGKVQTRSNILLLP